MYLNVNKHKLFSNSLRSNENNLIYFRKQLGNKENESFLLVEPCSRVRCCAKINLQFLFVKYISICTILCPINATYIDNSLWLVLSSWWQQRLGKTYSLRYQNKAMISDFFAYRKTKTCRQHGLLFWGWHFYNSVCVRWAVIGRDATKVIQCNNI